MSLPDLNEILPTIANSFGLETKVLVERVIISFTAIIGGGMLIPKSVSKLSEFLDDMQMRIRLESLKAINDTNDTKKLAGKISAQSTGSSTLPKADRWELKR